jgi:hypothetical protein
MRAYSVYITEECPCGAPHKKNHWCTVPCSMLARLKGVTVTKGDKNCKPISKE